MTQRLGDLKTALGIEAASFASGYRERVLGMGFDTIPNSRSQFSEQRYSGKPDGDSRNAQIKLNLDEFSHRKVKQKKIILHRKLCIIH